MESRSGYIRWIHRRWRGPTSSYVTRMYHERREGGVSHPLVPPQRTYTNLASFIGLEPISSLWYSPISWSSIISDHRCWLGFVAQRKISDTSAWSRKLSQLYINEWIFKKSSLYQLLLHFAMSSTFYEKDSVSRTVSERSSLLIVRGAHLFVFKSILRVREKRENCISLREDTRSFSTEHSAIFTDGVIDNQWWVVDYQS